MTSRRRLALLLFALLAGCEQATPPPLQIMGAEFGLLEKDADGRTRIAPAAFLPLREGQLYGWRLVLRTDKERIQLTEQLTLAAPADWNVGKDPRYEVSPDRRSITFLFKNYGGIDGVDFRTRCAPSVKFAFQSDGKATRTSRIVIGRNNHHPRNNPFSIHR